MAGNHCVGDKPTGWVPVPRVSEESLARFERFYGSHFYSFDHGLCHFVVLNSLLVNSEHAAEREQRSWLENDLTEAARKGQRSWLLMHYPAFVATPDEPGSYDNLDQPGRTWLLELLERHRIEAAFSGHVHNYFTNRFAGTELYTLPATSFVRQDYSELFSVAPEDAEGGRDDRAKLGYCLVEVYEGGHVTHLVRTHGRTLGPEDLLEEGEQLGPVHMSGAEPAPVAIEMRENWLGLTWLRTNNSVSPFTRRAARNDWAVAALEEMGVRRVRLALHELDVEEVRARMFALAERGYEFTVYSHGVPHSSERDLVFRNRAQLSGWELILQLDHVETMAAKLIGGRFGDSGLPCYLSELRDVDRRQIADANVKHEANYGFQLHERDKVADLCASAAVREAFAGLVFRIRRRGEPRVAPWAAIREIGAMGDACGMRHQVHILFSGDLTAERMVDDLATANRVAESTLAAIAAGNVGICFDTFEDTDRGYFVRRGLVDGRYNPRPAARVLRHLGAALARYRQGAVEEARCEELDGGRLVTLRCGARILATVLPQPHLAIRELDVPGTADGDSLILVDLESGAVSSLPAAPRGGTMRLERRLELERPSLLVG